MYMNIPLRLFLGTVYRCRACGCKRGPTVITEADTYSRLQKAGALTTVTVAGVQVTGPVLDVMTHVPPLMVYVTCSPCAQGTPRTRHQTLILQIDGIHYALTLLS